MEKINLGKILNKHIASKTSLETDYDDVVFIKRAMLEACKQTLELAAENARLIFIDDEDPLIGQEYISAEVDRQSILNTINQIE